MRTYVVFNKTNNKYLFQVIWAKDSSLADRHFSWDEARTAGRKMNLGPMDWEIRPRIRVPFSK